MTKLNVSPFLDNCTVPYRELLISCPQHLKPLAERLTQISHPELNKLHLLCTQRMKIVLRAQGSKRKTPNYSHGSVSQ